MVTEADLDLPGGGTLHFYDTGTGDLPVIWHHGTPNIGTPPAPLYAQARDLGIRWIGYDRPGYGGSTPVPDRDIASAATYSAAVADALGLDRFAVMGHSGGGPHALACAALLPDRVLAAVSGAGLAPYDAPGLDWYDGMAPSGVASLTAAARGRTAKEAHEASGAQSEPEFTEADVAMFQGEWRWLLDVVNPAVAAGPGGLISDDLAYTHPWGCDPTRITAPVLLLHGGRDRIVPSAHSRWLADHCPTAELRLNPDAGHISILSDAPAALAWLAARARA